MSVVELWKAWCVAGYWLGYVSAHVGMAAVVLLILDRIRGRPAPGAGRDSLLALKGGESVISFRTREEAQRFRGTVDRVEVVREECPACGGEQKRLHIRVDAHPPPGAKIGEIIVGVTCVVDGCERREVQVLHARFDA